LPLAFDYNDAYAYGPYSENQVYVEAVMNNVLITGCSSGIGFATAVALARAGHKVFATMRNPVRAPQLAQIAANEQLPIEIHTLDVDSDDSVRACFAGIKSPIDVLVNNAGIEVHGTVEELPIESIVAVMNTNYFGLVRCIKAVLPQMRERRDGCIINIASVAGHISSSPLGAYSASKFAVEAISEALAGEVRPFNIRVAVVEPGIQDTAMAHAIEDPSPSLYRQPARFSGLFRAALANPVSPDVTANLIRGIIESGTWKLRHRSGPDAEPFVAWRAAMTDEQWIDWNAQDDAAWYDAVQRDFGLNARPESKTAAR
jgi:NAD(P)-dependent dehydrogenase (short-subunit alcohol dehydrogenase family)